MTLIRNAGSGTVLLLLTVFFYVPILVLEIRSPSRGGRDELRGRHVAVCSDCFTGGFWLGPTDRLRIKKEPVRMARLYSAAQCTATGTRLRPRFGASSRIVIQNAGMRKTMEPKTHMNAPAAA